MQGIVVIKTDKLRTSWRSTASERGVHRIYTCEKTPTIMKIVRNFKKALPHPPFQSFLLMHVNKLFFTSEHTIANTVLATSLWKRQDTVTVRTVLELAQHCLHMPLKRKWPTLEFWNFLDLTRRSGQKWASLRSVEVDVSIRFFRLWKKSCVYCTIQIPIWTSSVHLRPSMPSLHTSSVKLSGTYISTSWPSFFTLSDPRIRQCSPHPIGRTTTHPHKLSPLFR
jgi:hypothetical protein